MKKSSSQNVLSGFDSFEQRLGDELRGERATLGKSLLDVQRDLKIKAAYISAIEDCDVSVFPNSSFVAGYVRSYARYLKLDQEEIFKRFCVEANFKSVGAELGGNPKKSNQNANKTSSSIDDPNAWVPRMPGFGMDSKASGGAAGANLMAAGPAIVLALVIIALGYGVWFIMNDIQRVEFAPIEDNPMVAEMPQALGGSLSSDNSDRSLSMGIEIAGDPTALYSRRELEVPVVSPRDGPIFAINPDQDVEPADVGFEQDPETEIANLEAISEIIEPIVSETPHIPMVSVVAVQEAWVRVYEEDGTIIDEKIMAAGEQYALAADAPEAYLRAGNATSVYVMIDDKAYGPISTTEAVVKDIPLLPTYVADNMAIVDDPSVALQVAADAWREMHTAQVDE